MATLAAQTLAQDAHIVHSPTPYDIAPATSAERRFQPPPHHDDDELDFDSDEEDERASLGSSILQRPPRRPLPPLPDLRFEQSYMASIAPAQGVWWKIALITLKDQVLMPLLQGLGFNLALFGWRFWNRGVKFRGAGVGAKVRRWWWKTNNWELPRERGGGR